jgi:hypothetical protein
VAEVLAGPLAIAALVVGIAGVAKLRAPATAAGALMTLGVPGGQRLVRALAASEVLMAGWCLGWPGRWPAVALALAYGGFAGVAVALARRRAACGCFGGAGEGPVSAVHMWLSAALGAVCLAAAVRPAARVQSVTVAIGVAGAAYAIVLAYTELPAAWRAWSAG